MPATAAADDDKSEQWPLKSSSHIKLIKMIVKQQSLNKKKLSHAAYGNMCSENTINNCFKTTQY